MRTRLNRPTLLIAMAHFAPDIYEYHRCIRTHCHRHAYAYIQSNHVNEAFDLNSDTKTIFGFCLFTSLNGYKAFNN